jgi:hypothetical protein
MVVNSSGMELPIAFMVAPLTPSDIFLPKYSEAVSNPSLAFQMTKQQKTMSKIGTKISIINYFNKI